jgi:hypothetical protein
MNINELNQLIPDPYRALSVPETFLYYRDGAVFPISGQYIADSNDYLFKYTKTNGTVDIQEVKASDLPYTAYSAEDWVRKYFTSLEVLALMRLEQNILMQGKQLGPKMLASKIWLETMLIAQPSNSFDPAPHSYIEASDEAKITLEN